MRAHLPNQDQLAVTVEHGASAHGHPESLIVTTPANLQGHLTRDMLAHGHEQILHRSLHRCRTKDMTMTFTVEEIGDIFRTFLEDKYGISADHVANLKFHMTGTSVYAASVDVATEKAIPRGYRDADAG